MVDSNAPIELFWEEYRWLSNFYVNGKMPSVEHFYQAAKTLDEEWKQKIMAAPTPGKAKRLGSKAPLRPGWNSIRHDVMIKHVREKFKDPVLAQKLADTYPRQLVEGNTWHDNYWGNCTCEDCKNKEGLNMLGFILMTVRSEILHMGKPGYGN